MNRVINDQLWAMMYQLLSNHKSYTIKGEAPNCYNVADYGPLHLHDEQSNCYISIFGFHLFAKSDPWG